MLDGDYNKASRTINTSRIKSKQEAKKRKFYKDVILQRQRWTFDWSKGKKVKL